MIARVPLLPLMIGIIAGIVCQRFIGSFWIPVMFAVIALLCCRKTDVAIIALAAALGWIAGYIDSPMRFIRVPDSVTRFRAVVESVSHREASQTLTLDVDAVYTGNEPVGIAPFRAVATVSYNVTQLSPGDIVEFSGTWSKAEAQTDLPEENDMTSLYYARGVSLLVFVPDNSISQIGRSRNPVYELRRWRNGLVDNLYGSGLSDEAATFMAAIVAGDTDGIERSRSGDFARAGVAHVLALSGAHVAIVAALLSLLLAPIAFCGHRRLRWWLAISFLWVFAIATGGSASVVRSVIMASAVMLSLIFDRPRSSLNSLCLAAVIILVFSPRALFTVSFQLSFVATFGIIMFSDRLNPVKSDFAAKPILSAMIVTVGATLATLPLVAYTFHQIPVYFLLANIVAAFLMPALITGGVVLLLLHGIGLTASWLVVVLNALVSAFDAVSTGISSFPGAAIEGIYFSGWLLVPLYVALALFCLYMNSKKRKYAIAAVALVAVSIVAASVLKPSYSHDELYIVRNKSDMQMLVRRGSELSVITSSSPMNREADSAEIVSKYRDYISTRGITRISFLHVDSKHTPNFHFDFGGKRFKIANATVESTDSLPSNYCIVNRHFRGDIVALANRCNADTILLTADINIRRRKRFLKELSAAGIKVIDTSASAFNSLE